MREETKAIPGALLGLTDNKKREERRRKGEKGDEQGVSTSVCEWRLSLEGAVRGHRGGTVGTPPSPSPLFPLALEIPAGEMIDE